jgi:carbonic anhydrase
MAASIYGLINLTDEVINTHKSMLIDRVSSKDVQDDILAVLGGIDNILASALQQNLLTEDQLLKLKRIFGKKQKMDAPDLNEMDSMLDEIDAANAKKIKPFGMEQSPINLVTLCDQHSATSIMKNPVSSNPLKFNYPSLVEKCTILNNGHTVQINIHPSQKCTVSIKGKTYNLVQFHFHTPSEHKIDSKQFEMEMHLVHANEAGDLCVLGFIFTVFGKRQQPKLKLTKDRAHLVLSKESLVNNIGCLTVNDEESDDADTDDESGHGKVNKNCPGNDFLAQFWNEMPPKKTSEDIALAKPLSFDYLFECSSNSFMKNVKTNEIDIDMDIFEYDGGLTTPPYSEGVQWLVAKKVHYMSVPQLTKLSACWGNVINARACQEMCGRGVELRTGLHMSMQLQ